MSLRWIGWLFVAAYAYGGLLTIVHWPPAALIGGLMMFAAGLVGGILIAHRAQGIETEGHDPEEGHGAEHESPVGKADAP